MGRRFCSLDQFYEYFSGNYELFSLPKLNEAKKKKKVFVENWSYFSPKSGEDHKKKVFTGIYDHIRQEICRIFQSFLALFRLTI